MSFPPLNPSPAASRGRKIAPLPLRATSRCNNTSVGGSQNVISINETVSSDASTTQLLPDPISNRKESPHPSPSSVPSQGRQIAPLPLRFRSRSNGTPSSSSQDVTSTNDMMSPSSSSKTNQPSSTTSDMPYLEGKHVAGTDSNVPNFSPPTSDVPRIAFESGQESSLQVVKRSEMDSSRSLHDVTPRQSLETEDTKLLTFQESPMGMVRSTISEDQPDSTAITPYDSSSLVSPLSLTQTSHLSPSPVGLRQRSISDASDVSDNNDSNDSMATYDVRDEQAPLEPFFTPGFQAALKNGLGIANKVVSAIEKLIGSSEPSRDLQRLLQDARKLETYESSDTRTIAVLGDSGEGKSSLINALLHFPEIAKTGDIGSACTSVVTEYRQKTRDHAAPITIEVEYLSTSEIEELIKELLWNYRQLYLPEVEQDTVDSKDYERYQRESEQAWSALEAGFRHQSAFNKNLLTDMTEAGLAKATAKLIEWSQELEWPGNDNSGSWKATADTADECCEKTSIFMQDRFWPFTKIIRVYLSAQVLRTGVVLADLPGLQDTNLARVRATQTYLMKCDNVFIIAKISRALTDQSLKSSLYSVLAQHAPVEWEESGGKGLNLAVVCTKSEDINQKTARREFCGPCKKISPLIMEQLDKDIEDAKKSKNKVLKKQLKRKQEFLLIDARNNHVKDGLQKSYASKVPGGRLEVFCVSNTTYEKFSRKGDVDMVRASGIPELRQFCHKVTAEAQLLEAKHFLQSTLSSLLSSVELWASSSPPCLQVEDREQDESAQDVLQNVIAEISENFAQAKAEFEGTFREVLSEYLEQRNHFWEVAADTKGSEWAYWHWTQYNAWCLHNGNHYTAKRGSLNWNSELIWKMRIELAYQWGLLEDEIPATFKTLLQSTKTCLVDLKSYFKAQGFATPLVEGINFRIQDIEFKFRLAQQDFTREVKMVQRCASEPNASSYIVSEMIPAYRAAAGESGTGKAARQRAIVQGKITDGTLFPHISTKIQANIDKLVRKTFRDLHGAVDAVLKLIASDVELALASKPQFVDVTKDQEHQMEEEQKEKLLSEIKDLNVKHEDLLVSIILPEISSP